MQAAAGMLPALFLMCNAGAMAMFLGPGPARATAFMFPTPLQSAKSLSGVIRLNEATLAGRTCGLARFGGNGAFLQPMKPPLTDTFARIHRVQGVPILNFRMQRWGGGGGGGYDGRREDRARGGGGRGGGRERGDRSGRDRGGGSWTRAADDTAEIDAGMVLNLIQSRDEVLRMCVAYVLK